MSLPFSASLHRVRGLWQRSPFARNVGSTLGTQLASIVITMFNGAIVARLLGTEGKGILALVVLVPNMLALFLNGGLSMANVYFTGRKRFDVATLSSNSVAFALVATAVGAVVTIAIYASGWLPRVLPGVPPDLLALGMLSLPISLLNSFFTTILQGLQQIRQINRVSLIQRTSAALLTILFVFVLRWHLAGAVIAMLLSLSLSLGMLMRALRGHGASFRPRWRRPVLNTTLKFGLRGYVANLLQFFNYRLDLFLVNFFLGVSGAGIYTTSVGMAEMLWNLPNAVGFVIFPKSANSSAAEMNRFTPRVFRATLMFTALGGVLLALVGKPFINLVYTPAFAAAYVPLLALLPGVVLLGGAKVLTNEISGRGYPQYNSITSGVSLILTVIFDLLLIPRYGVLGASLASTLAYSTIFLLALYYYRRVSQLAGDTARPSGSVTSL